MYPKEVSHVLWDVAASEAYRHSGVEQGEPSAYSNVMERVVHKARSFAEADAWDRNQQHRMSPQERIRASRELQRRAFGSTKDIRACHRTK